ncbi:MAG: hypothetical protein PPP56_01225 [Longimonas sp.]|uniref:hypothetical protein n=1 Tax=Longimonas sp. TaxID=2039626 RepID=UPI003357DED5
MDTPEQKALLIRIAGDETHGLASLNEHLSNGWHVIETTALGGGHATETAALVVIENQRRGPATGVPVAEREAEPADEEIEEIVPGVEETVEGDGASPDVDPEINPGSA